MNIKEYKTSDIDFFISYCNIAAKNLENKLGGISIGLLEVSTFLHKLVAEGYINNESNGI